MEDEAQLAIGLPKIVLGTSQEFDITSGPAPKLARKQVSLITQVENVLQRTVAIPELVSGVSVLVVVLGVPDIDVSDSLKLAIRVDVGDRADPTPLCCLPPLHSLPLDWVMRKVEEIWNCVGLSFEGFE